MRKILFLIFTIIPLAAIAETINWIVDNTVYQTTTCESGDSITPPIAPTKYGYTFRQWESLYTQLEYIESSGTQCIDTGVRASSNYLKLSGEISYNNFSPTGYEFVLFFGSHDNSCALNLFAGSTSDSVTSAGIEIGLSYGLGISAGALNTDTIYDFELEAKDGYLNGHFHNIVYANVAYSPSLNNTASLHLFSSSLSGIPYAFVSGRCYRFQMYDIGGIVRNFVPVRRKSDNAVGMYDTVSHTFFENNCSGSFIAGPVVGE